MEEKILKKIAMQSLSLMFAVIFLSVTVTKQMNHVIYVNNYGDSDHIVYAKTIEDEEGIKTEGKENNNGLSNGSLTQIKNGSNNGNNSVLGNKYIKIRKQENTDTNINADFNLTNLYMEKRILISMEGLSESPITEKDIIRVNNQKEFFGIPEQNKSDDIALDISITYDYNPQTQKYTTLVSIQLDSIYAENILEDQEYYYVDLRKPSDVYDKILVVDFGHGGMDAGTYSSDRKYFEDDLNLSIGLELKKLLDQENIKVYYTRLEDEKVYLNPRINLANELNADFMVSIHCNANNSSAPYGTEVLYNELDTNNKFNSKMLADICLKELVNEIGTKNRGIIPSSSNVYIIEKAKIPIALIEVGYMSNYSDLSFLVDEGNHQKIAKGIYSGIIKAYEILDKNK